MLNAECAICQSPLRGEIEKRDASGRADQTIQWARKQGLNISRFSLAKHRSNHADSPSQKPQQPPHTFAPPDHDVKPAAPASEAPVVLKSKSENISDQLFLDTVRDMVFQRLLDGEIKLDVGDGFKAIEIKHKIAEESQNEKMLLEILNEIRSEELQRSKRQP